MDVLEIQRQDTYSPSRVLQQIELPSDRLLRLASWRTARDRPAQQPLQTGNEIRIAQWPSASFRGPKRLKLRVIRIARQEVGKPPDAIQHRPHRNQRVIFSSEMRAHAR